MAVVTITLIVILKNEPAMDSTFTANNTGIKGTNNHKAARST